jgi:uncharacterized protein
MSKNEIGAITWVDLTVQNADEIRDFYQSVVGWKPDAVDMGGYSDYNMSAPESMEPKAGVCYARGGNADLPSQWLIYITIANLEESMENCRRNGGKIISGPRSVAGHGKYCVIQDPAGAVAALFEKV